MASNRIVLALTGMTIFFLISTATTVADDLYDADFIDDEDLPAFIPPPPPHAQEIRKKRQEDQKSKESQVADQKRKERQVADQERKVRQETVDWRCDGPKGSTCYFSIRYSGGAGQRNFTMRGSERDRISGVVPKEDRYCVCVDTPTPEDWSQCNKHYQGKFFCNQATVRRGINN